MIPSGPEWRTTARRLAWPLTLGVVALLAFVGVRTASRAYQRLTGQLREQDAVHKREQRTYRDSLARLATRYRVDTVHLTTTTVRWRDVQDVAAGRPATVPLPPAIVEALTSSPPTVRESVLVAAADTVIRACGAALLTCEQRRVMLDSLLVIEQRRGALVRKLQPGLFARLRGTLTHVALGVALGFVVGRQR